MKSFYKVQLFLFISCSVLAGCHHFVHPDEAENKLKIGVLLADDGLGDHSFNDTAFLGLMKARDELGIDFDYRDLSISSSFKDGLVELVEGNYDLIIGLGYTMEEDFIEVALNYPDQHFLYIDEKIELSNVTSITFNEYEGSYLAGVIAGFKTETNSIGFLGGMDAPVIEKFKEGFIAGVKAVNPNAKMTIEYADSFGAPEKGRQLVASMVEHHDIDVIFPAAGYTGLGALEEAVHQEIYAIGVDSDQFYIAEQAVITSMLKNIDVAIFTAIKELTESRSLSKKHIELGLLQNGVGIAPIRLVSLTEEEQAQLDFLTGKLLNSTGVLFPIEH
jgi:basic membrane protein A